MEKGGYALTSYRSLKPGEFITLGTYGHSMDGKEQAITWPVLQNSGSELLVLSEHILDCKRYHGKSAYLTWRDCMDISWHDCDLREWLNHEFYNVAFNDADKQLIKTERAARIRRTRFFCSALPR